LLAAVAYAQEADCTARGDLTAQGIEETKERHLSRRIKDCKTVDLCAPEDWLTFQYSAE
jgi:hypothetical protein